MKENVCLVCLKTFQSFPNNHPSLSQPPQVEKCCAPLLTKFLKFANNYLKVALPVPIQKLLNINCSTEAFTEAFCERCELAVITPICQVYLEYLSAQLRLSFELEQLGKLLDSSQVDMSMSNQSRVMNVRKLTEQLGVEGPSNLEEFRSLLSQKCQLKRKETLPDILVQSRCRNDQSIRLQTVSLSDENDDDDDPISLGAVDPRDEQSYEDETEETFEVTENGRFELKNIVTKIKVGPVQLLQDNHLMVVPDNEDVEEEVHDRQNPSSSAPDNWHKCSECERFFDSLKGLNLHISKCSGFKQQTTKKGKEATGAIPCDLCDRLFHTRKRMSDHKYHAHATKRFKCPKCDYIAKTRSSVNEHFIALHNPQTHACGHCPKTFTTRRYLQYHIRRAHPLPGQINVLRMDSSGETYENANDDDGFDPLESRDVDVLDLQLQSDKPVETNGICENLKVEVDSTQFLQELQDDDHHLIIPENEDMEEVDDHSPPKFGALHSWHKCEKCECFFESLRGLNCHLGVCSGPKTKPTKVLELVGATVAFPCGVCDRLFPTSERRNGHKYHAHTKKQYQCPKCDYIAKGRDRLRQHFISIHNHQTHACGHCPKTFTTRRYLQHHIRLVHPLPGQTKLVRRRQKLFCPNPGCDRHFETRAKLNHHLTKCTYKASAPTKNEVNVSNKIKIEEAF